MDDRRGIRPLYGHAWEGDLQRRAAERGPSGLCVTDRDSSDVQGFADFADAVAPSLAFTSASATKLRRPARAYSIHVALSLRDDVEGNTVAYRLRVYEGPE